MKYIKTYEQVTNEYTFSDLFSDKFDPANIFEYTCLREELTSLDGIENLPNLTYFDCGINTIKSLKPLKILKNLESLYCSNNEITSFKGLEELVNLKNIGCNDNKIQSLLPLKNLKNLKTLEVSSNKLTTLDGIENLTKLKDFDCRNNNIRDLIPSKFLDYKYSYGHDWERKYYVPMILSYEFQKETLTKNPDKLEDLINNIKHFDKWNDCRKDVKFEIHPKIKEEFTHLFDMKGIGL